MAEAGHSLEVTQVTQDTAPGHLPPSETYRHPSATVQPPPSGPVTQTEAGIYSPGGSVQLDELGATRGLDTVADGPADGARSFRVTQVTQAPV